jgi:response regulator RpfG family c-di-GMP phosphodiesterase
VTDSISRIDAILERSAAGIGVGSDLKTTDITLGQEDAQEMPIRARIILIVLPLLVVGIIITGAVTTLAATSGMTRLAMRLMAFESQELSKYMYSQWDLLVRNQFADRPEFVAAAQQSIGAYAGTLTHSATELIFAVDPSGQIVLSTRPVEPTEAERAALLELIARKNTGWVEVTLEGLRLVGEAAPFLPFDWTVFTTDERAGFYQEIREIILKGVVVLACCVAVTVVLLLVFSRYLTRPLSSMVETIEGIIHDREFSRKVAVEYDDELGSLANRFNHMTASLLRTYNEVKDHAYREAVARKQVIQREYETLIVLGKAAEYKDPSTGMHIARVAHYSRILAGLLGETEESQNLVYYASPMHDIGKMGIPDSILLKPAGLTAEEFDMLKTHTTIAYDMLKDSRSVYLRTGAEIALTHHEWFDGSGYPQGLRGRAIPLFGRIVGLADAFDAVTSRRPYKEVWDLDRAFGMLEEESNTHFDPRLVELFVGHRQEVRRIYEAHREA